MTETPGGAKWQNNDKKMFERESLATESEMPLEPGPTAPEQRPDQAPRTSSDTNKRSTSYPQSS